VKRVLSLSCIVSALLLSACSFGGATEPPPTPSAVPVTPTNRPTATPPAPSPDTAAATQAANAGGCKPGTGQVVTTASELKYTDLLICDGVEARPGMTVAVNYVGMLKDGGVQFDSSYDRSQPKQFILGRGQVIQGWDEGIVGMRVGSKRRLIIPPSLGYGNTYIKGIPPGSTLVFEVELVSAK